MKIDNYERIIEALEIIKKICSESGCDTCLFGDNDAECNITRDNPEDWNIVMPEEVVRLMK